MNRRALPFAVAALLVTLSLTVLTPSVTALDTTSPSVSVLTPADGGLFNTSLITLSWEGEDTGENATGMAEYRVKMDDGDWANMGLLTDHTYNFLSDGEHYVQVKAVDQAGNEAIDTVSFNIDTTTPAIDILSPADDSALDRRSVLLQWEGSDENSGIDTYQLWINGQEAYDMGDVDSFTVPPLTDGDYQLEVRAYDNAGNLRADSVMVSVDTLPPTVDILSPAPWQLLSDESVLIAWEAEDQGTGVETYEVLIDDSMIKVTGGTEMTTPPLSNGHHTVTVIAHDRAGHASSDSRDLNIDTMAPELTIMSPEEGELMGNSSVRVTVLALDENSGVDHFEVRVDDRAPMHFASGNVFTLPSLSHGDHGISVTAFDLAGNAATDSVNITLTDVAPEVSILSEGGTYSSSSVTVEWTSETSASPIDHYEVGLDGLPWIDVGRNISITLSDLEEGEHSLTVRAHDVAGNLAEDSLTFTVDTVAPVITITSPSYGQAFPERAPSMTWTGEDVTTSVVSYRLSIDNSSWMPMGTAMGFDLPSLACGEHVATLGAMDDAGNLAESSVLFYIDNVAPLIDDLRLNGTNATGAFRFDLTVEETGSSVASREYALDEGEWTTFMGDLSLPLAEGEHVLSLRIADLAGNIGEASLRFDTDLTAPSLISSSPEGENVSTDSVLLMIFSEPMDPASMVVSGASGTISVDGSTVLFTPSGLEGGITYTLTVNGADLAGNAMEESSWSFTTTEVVGGEVPGEGEGLHWSVYLGIGAVIGVLAFLIIGMGIIKLRQRRGLFE